MTTSDTAIRITYFDKLWELYGDSSISSEQQAQTATNTAKELGVPVERVIKACNLEPFDLDQFLSCYE